MLLASYKTGSQCILPKSHDNDVLLIFETKEEAKEYLINNKDDSVNWHYDSLDCLPRIFLGCYIYHFVELIDGEEIEAIKNFNLFEHTEKYKGLIKKRIKWSPREDKSWYHIYLAYVFFKKGKMTLTKKEKEKAQEIHDNGISDEEYETIVKYFTEE